MLLSLIKKSFKQILENNSLILFLVGYLILTGLIAPFAKTGLLVLILGICIILLTIVFFSGWLQMYGNIAKPKNSSEKDKNIFSVFTEGVGRNFFSALIGFIIYIFVMFILLYLTGKIANHFFGDINVILKSIMASAAENNNIRSLILELPDEKQYTLYGWQFCLYAASGILGFVFLLYCPALISSDSSWYKRPFVAFVDSIKVTCKNILPTIGLYAMIYACYVVLSILRALADYNNILSVIMFFIYIYFLVLVVMIIFNYYEEKTNSSYGTDSIGEDESCNTTGEEN